MRNFLQDRERGGIGFVFIILFLIVLIGGFLFYRNSTKQAPKKLVESKTIPKSQPAKAQSTHTQSKTFSVALLTNGPVSDWGFNYAHDQGIKYAQKILGDQITTRTVENVPETGDAERIMRRLINEGTDLIIAASFGYQDTSVKLAQEFPNVKFLQAWGFKPSKNLGTYSSQMYQAWYVVGIVAGKMTKSNKLGIVAAHPIPPMKWQINAYVLGARSVNPKVTAHVTYINHWFDPGLATEASEALIAKGCDVLCGVLDNSVAVAQTAEKRGVYFIGHNADLRDFAPSVYLVGTRWMWGKLYVDVIRRMLQEAWDGRSGDIYGGFKEGYVGITPFSALVPHEVQKFANEFIQRFKEGKFHVYSGPIRDNTGKIVVKKGQTLSHAQIMQMNWLVEGIM